MFRAYDAGRERLVAVKLFKLDLPPERVHQLVAAFERLIASELTHPALAVPLGTGIAGMSAYLAQDYVAAESLDLAVREYGVAPPADALRVAAQLAGALDFAAAVNVSHGALHPRDVLLSSDETRMTGIGVAAALESVGVAAPIRRPYTAPERIAGAHQRDRRADVFSLAALIHELLWARRITGTGDQIAETLTDLPGANLRALQRIFARALADDPAARFDTALQFVEALKTGFPAVTIGRHEQSAVGSRQEMPQQSAVRSRPSKEPEQSADGSRRSKEFEQPAVGSQQAGRAVGASADRRLPTVPADRPLPTVPADSLLPTAHVNREPRLPLDAPDSVLAAFEPEPPVPTATFDDDAFNLREAEAARFQQIDTAPALAPQEEVAPMREEPMPEDSPISLVEESRSAVWPLVASLLIGLALGFAGGYGIGTREHPAMSNTAAPAPTPAREATDVAIAETQERKQEQSAVGSQQGAKQEQSAVGSRQAAKQEQSAVSGPQAVKPEQSAVGSRQAAKPEQSAGRSRQTQKSTNTANSQPTAGSRTPTKTADGRPPTARTATPTARAATPTSATTGGYQGGLTVDSRPTGARVFLDGRMIGTTPLVLPAVPAGEHAIRIERDGYRRWSSSVRIVAAEQNRVTASLER